MTHNFTFNFKLMHLLLSGGNIETFLGGGSAKTYDHDFDKALIKNSWGSV